MRNLNELFYQLRNADVESYEAVFDTLWEGLDESEIEDIGERFLGRFFANVIDILTRDPDESMECDVSALRLFNLFKSRHTYKSWGVELSQIAMRSLEDSQDDRESILVCLETFNSLPGTVIEQDRAWPSVDECDETMTAIIARYHGDAVVIRGALQFFRAFTRAWDFEHAQLEELTRGILKALAAHPADVRVSEPALRLLYHIGRHSKQEALGEIVPLLISSDLVALAMSAAAQEPVINAAMDVLTLLIEVPGTNALFNKHGAALCRLLMQTCQNHSGSEQLVTCCVKLLSAFSCKPMHKGTISYAPVIDAIHRLLACENLQDEAFAWLANTGHACHHCSVLIARNTNCFEYLLDMIEHHMNTDFEACHRVFSALAHITRGIANTREGHVRAEKVLAKVAHVLSEFSDVPNYVNMCFFTLGELAAAEGMAPLIVRSGILPRALQILRANADLMPIQRQGLFVLEPVLTLCSAAAQCEIIEILTLAVNHFPSDLLLSPMLKAVENFAQGGDRQMERLCRNDTLRTIAAIAMDSYEGDPDVTTRMVGVMTLMQTKMDVCNSGTICLEFLHSVIATRDRQQDVLKNAFDVLMYTFRFQRLRSVYEEHDFVGCLKLQMEAALAANYIDFSTHCLNSLAAVAEDEKFCKYASDKGLFVLLINATRKSEMTGMLPATLAAWASVTSHAKYSALPWQHSLEGRLVSGVQYSCTTRDIRGATSGLQTLCNIGIEKAPAPKLEELHEQGLWRTLLVEALSVDDEGTVAVAIRCLNQLFSSPWATSVQLLLRCEMQSVSPYRNVRAAMEKFPRSAVIQEVGQRFVGRVETMKGDDLD